MSKLLEFRMDDLEKVLKFRMDDLEKVLKFRMDDLEKEYKDLSEKLEKLSGDNTQQQSSSSPYYDDAMQNRQNIPQRQQGKTKQGGLFAQNYAAAKSPYGKSAQAPPSAAPQALFLRFPFCIRRDPNDPDTLYTLNKVKLPNIDLHKYAGYNMLASAVSADDRTGCGLFYYNTDNPQETLEVYVQYRIQKYMDESKKKLEENLRRKREEEIIKAKKWLFSAKRCIFDVVRAERSKPDVCYLQLNSSGKSFNEVSSFGNYIMIAAKNGTHVVIPNQVDPFDSSMISDSVYSCNTNYVEDDTLCIKYCLVDEDKKIIQRGTLIENQSEKQSEKAQKKQTEEEQKRRLEAEEARKKQEEDEKRRKAEEEKAKYAAKKKIFDLVRNERNKPNARYLQLNPDGRSFSCSSSSGSYYIMLVNKNGTRAALPNQVDPFDSSMISNSVYSCNTDYVEDDSICRRYCIIDEDYKILQQGIIEA